MRRSGPREGHNARIFGGNPGLLHHSRDPRKVFIQINILGAGEGRALHHSRSGVAPLTNGGRKTHGKALQDFGKTAFLRLHSMGCGFALYPL